MAPETFARARSREAKQQRERAILDAARDLAASNGVRTVTLTDVAAAIGMHKSALLRYFETREQILLLLTADCWRDWSADLRGRSADIARDDAAALAAAIARSLTDRPLFCDLLSHVPLHLERHVSVESVRAFKLVTHEELDRIVEALQHVLPLSVEQAVDVVSTATSLAGAMWQMATPPPEVAELYRTDPRLGHAIVEVRPRLERILSGLLTGFTDEPTRAP